MDEKLLDAYFAGLIDGEGNIAVYTFKSGVVRPIVKVDMTCEKTIKAIHSHFGGYIGQKKTECLANRKPQWRWEVTFQKALAVCSRIRPFLITKAENADTLLSYKPGPRGKHAKPKA